MSHYIFTWLCGGMAFRAVARTHEMLKPEDFISRPQFLNESRIAPVLVTVAFFGVLAASALSGWHHSSIVGVVLHPVQVFCASSLLDMAITKGLPLRLQYSFFFNPIVHLYVLPWIYIVGVVIKTVV